MWVLAIEICVAAVEQPLLLAGADAAAGGFAVLAVQRVGDGHPLDDFAERHEALLVLVRVVAQADVDLRRPPVGDGEREGDAASRHRLSARIVGDGLLAPRRRYRRILVDPELRPLA